jgi:hypothetical protein
MVDSGTVATTGALAPGGTGAGVGGGRIRSALMPPSSGGGSGVGAGRTAVGVAFGAGTGVGGAANGVAVEFGGGTGVGGGMIVVGVAVGMRTGASGACVVGWTRRGRRSTPSSKLRTSAAAEMWARPDDGDDGGEALAVGTTWTPKVNNTTTVTIRWSCLRDITRPPEARRKPIALTRTRYWL